MLSSERDNLRKVLKNCKTVAEVFKVLDDLYELENAQLGNITRPLFIEGAIKGVALISPKKR